MARGNVFNLIPGHPEATPSRYPEGVSRSASLTSRSGCVEPVPLNLDSVHEAIEKCGCIHCDPDTLIESMINEAKQFQDLVESGGDEAERAYRLSVISFVQQQGDMQPSIQQLLEHSDDHFRKLDLCHLDVNLDCLGIRELVRIVEAEDFFFGVYAGNRLRYHDLHRADEPPLEKRRPFFRDHRTFPQGPGLFDL